MLTFAALGLSLACFSYSAVASWRYGGWRRYAETLVLALPTSYAIALAVSQPLRRSLYFLIENAGLGGFVDSVLIGTLSIFVILVLVSLRDWLMHQGPLQLAETPPSVDHAIVDAMSAFAKRKSASTGQQIHTERWYQGRSAWYAVQKIEAFPTGRIYRRVQMAICEPQSQVEPPKLYLSPVVYEVEQDRPDHGTDSVSWHNQSAGIGARQPASDRRLRANRRTIETIDRHGKPRPYEDIRKETEAEIERLWEFVSAVASGRPRPKPLP